MKQWNIWDFPENLEVFIENNARNELFETLYKRFGSQKEYAAVLKKDRNDIQGYHHGRGWDKGKKHPKLIPLKILAKSLQFIDEELRLKIEKNILEIRTHGGKSIKNPILPIIESPALYRVAAHVLADGNDSHTPYYANTCLELCEQFKKDLTIFGEVDIYESLPNTVPCINFPKVITRILAKILDVQFTHPDRLPKAIFRAPKECQTAFLQSLFDDEGTMSTLLAIGMNNEKIIERIRDLLNSLLIETSSITTVEYRSKAGDKAMHYVSVKSKSYLEFQKWIGFAHPKKKEYLGIAINIKNRSYRTRPLEYTEEKILELLSTKQCTAIELARTLRLTVAGVSYHLKRLEERQEIIKKFENGRQFWDIV